MSSDTTKYTLPESEIPTHWVNLLPDLPGDPIPPLNPEDATWADQLLRAAGLRKRRGPASRPLSGDSVTSCLTRSGGTWT